MGVEPLRKRVTGREGVETGGEGMWGYETPPGRTLKREGRVLNKGSFSVVVLRDNDSRREELDSFLNLGILVDRCRSRCGNPTDPHFRLSQVRSPHHLSSRGL